MPIIPKVHMNGTSARELLKQITDANSKINEALQALAKMTPNGRDYYHTGNLREAETEHRARVDALLRIQDEIMEIAEGIADQDYT